MSTVKAENLHYDYLKYTDESEEPEITHALKGVELDVKEGMFIAVAGNNGCGKSTLAKHINALLAPTEGTVWVCGMDTRDEKNTWNIRQSAGLVFQNPDNQIIASVVEEDVAFGPENLGVPTDEIWKRVDEALGATGMTAYRHLSANKLSGGQKQRLAIAGVMAMRPKCIVLDEPTAMLDPEGRREVLSALKALNRKQKVTIILITHYMEETVAADRIFVMEDGRIKISGTPKEVFSDVEEIKRTGLDVPQVTLLAHELAAAGAAVNEPVLTADELVEQICRSN
jgi:energy-coupling factor transporter ATPase